MNINLILQFNQFCIEEWRLKSKEDVQVNCTVIYK